MRVRLVAFLSLAAAFVVAPLACGSTEGTADDAGATPQGTVAPPGPSASASVPTKDAASAPDAVANDASADGSIDAPTDGPKVPPIVAPANTWTYVPIPGMVCGNGSQTGIAVNPASDPAAPVLFLLMGGGACWNDVTCLGGAASNLDTEIDEAAIRADIARFPILFDRALADNAFKTHSYVFVPYCTGDLHAGNAQKTYRLLTKSQTIEHRGARNLDALLPHVAATFPRAPKVVIGGGSAGGFGTMLGYHQFRAYFPAQRLDILNDSGTPIEPSGSIWGDMQSAWNMRLPASCAGCTQDPRAILPYLATQMGPQARFGLLTYTEDRTIRSFTGVLLPQQFSAAVSELKTRLGPRQKMFVVGGDDHVIIKQNPLPSAQGVSAVTWLQRFASDDPAWDTVGP